MNAKQALRQANLSKWTAIFHDQKASGMTVKAWCSQNDVSIHAFYYWKSIAKETYVKSLIPDIVPIQVATADSIPDTQPENSNLELYAVSGLQRTVLRSKTDAMRSERTNL